ncbi:MAG: hypothetical protein HC817_14715 [Saprospiraceae bacterium]|nr:hypothetical protein [Saprospiraceae bacterium]
MKSIKYLFLLLIVAFSMTSCDDYLDVNENPNFPYETDVPPHVLLSPMQQQYALGIAFDGRFIGRYTQNWVDPGVGNVWDRHGYAAGSDAGGDVWRNHYWALGKNLDVMADTARRAGRNIYVGIAYALKALSWQTLTDGHGDVI